MTKDELRTRQDQIIERIRETATEEGVNIAELNQRRIEDDQDQTLTVWIYPDAESEARIKLVIQKQQVRFYDSDSSVKNQVAQYIQASFQEGIK